MSNTTLTPEQREAIYHAWIAALRSGQYKQGQFRLERDGRFCCLGVLCHVLHTHPELGIEMQRSEVSSKEVMYSTQSAVCYSRVPFSVEISELGLSVRLPGRSRAVENELAALNDDRQASFAEIAQFIEGAVMPLLRAKGVLPSASASAQQEAPEDGITLEQAESHAHICSKLAEEHKSDPVLFAALTDAAAIIRDLLRELRRETERRWEGNRRAAQEYVEDMRDVLKEAAQICKDLDDEALAKEDRLACGAECAAAIADLAARWNVPFDEEGERND